MLLLRHAQSTYLAAHVLMKPTLNQNKITMTYEEDEEFFNNWVLSPEFVDAEITFEGVLQCKNVQLPDQLHSIVLVSPLRRTIQTACLVLENHPMKHELVLRLCPDLIE